MAANSLTPPNRFDPAAQPPTWWLAGAAIACPRRRDRVIEQVLDNEALLIDGVSGQAFRINRTALDVWRMIEPATSTHDLAARLGERYEVDFDAALNDVEQLLAFFAGAGLLEPANR